MFAIRVLKESDKSQEPIDGLLQKYDLQLQSSERVY